MSWYNLVAILNGIIFISIIVKITFSIVKFGGMKNIVSKTIYSVLMFIIFLMAAAFYGTWGGIFWW